MGIKDWIEEHPYLTGSLVLAIIILYFVLSGSSSSSQTTAATSAGVGGTGLSSSDYAGLQAAQLASATQLQGQQNAATEQGNQLSAELAATQLQTQAQTTQSQLAAQVALQNIVTSGQVQFGAQGTAAQIAQIQTGGQVQIAGIGAGENETITGLQQQTLQDQIAAGVQSQKIVSDAQTAQNSANTGLLASVLSALKNITGSGTSTTTATLTSAPTITPDNTVQSTGTPLQTIIGNTAFASPQRVGNFVPSGALA